MPTSSLSIGGRIRHMRSFFVHVWAICALAVFALFLGVAAVNALQTPRQDIARKSTLVVYVFANTDKEAYPNLLYFLTNGIVSCDTHDYAIILQQGSGVHSLPSSLPNLPSCASYISHDNDCYDLGTVGWYLANLPQSQLDQYDYFMWINSSVRGPFLPSYVGQLWTRVFTDRIDAETKLSGTVLSCGGLTHSKYGTRENPHLQSYALATDGTGLSILKSNGVFDCHANYMDTVYNGELGGSLAILQAGFNLASTLARYADVDWRDKNNWSCNRKMSPTIPGAYDGTDLHPYEAIFVKIKQEQSQWPTAQTAMKLQTWQLRPAVSSNVFVDAKGDQSTTWAFLRPYFDVKYYAQHSRDLKSFSDGELWNHFVSAGLFEQRPFRLMIGGAPVPFAEYGKPPQSAWLKALHAGAACCERKSFD